MNHEVMQKWAKALRSGDYQQIDGRLRSYEPDDRGKYSYCCLGVLCELHRQEFNADGSGHRYAWGEAKKNEASKPTTAYDSHVDDLPPSVKEWAGIEMNSPVVYLDDEELTDAGEGGAPIELIGLNDDAGWSFERIANVIEEQWKDL
jgi:hypothetical protein